MQQDKVLFILGGTFDPVHHGHLRLASELTMQMPQAEIRLMPSGQPVHRSKPQASAKQRLEMLQLAIADSEVVKTNRIKIDAYEINREAASYSIETLQHLRKTMPRRSIVWVLGQDAYKNLGSWYRVSELEEHCHLLVVNRPGNAVSVNENSFGFTGVESLDFFETKPAGFELQLELPMLEISSTRIRQLINHNESVRWLLPDAIISYIQQNKLYKKGN